MSPNDEEPIRTFSMPRGTARLLVLGLLATLFVASPAPASAVPADLVPPEHITVCRSSGAVETVRLKDYVKTVLPREFPSTWPIEAIKAGAVAVTSYAWYHIEHPYSDRCHLTDTTRHQKYDPSDPHNPPTPKTNAAVDETWHWRLEENGQPAFAQYCNCSWFPEGRHIQQAEARDLAAAGWDHVAILAHSYRNLSNYRLHDWRQGFGVAYDGAQPFAIEPDTALHLTVGVAGVRAGDPHVPLHFSVACTMDGSFGWHRLQTAYTVARDGRTVADFQDTARLRDCAQDQVVVRVDLVVKGNLLLSADGAAWKPWISSTARTVERVAPSDDPSVASIAVSQQLFADRETTAQASGSDPLAEVVDPQEPTTDTPRQARAVVLARSDRFPDSLSATGLAGPDAPILLNPGGPDATLRADVRAEIDRVLDAGDTVHLVGGTSALPSAIEQELRDAAYDVQRHGGESRVETALAVADAVLAETGDVGTVLLARAWGPGSAAWADAVAAGAYAAAARRPVLLTSDAELTGSVEAWVETADHEVDEVVILGGPAAVPAHTEQRLDVPTTRVAGESRGATATSIAQELWSRGETPAVTGAMLVDGYEARDWPFALTAAVYAANVGTPQLLTHRLVPLGSTGAWLDQRPELDITIVGGDRVVDPRVEDDASGPT